MLLSGNGGFSVIGKDGRATARINTSNSLFTGIQFYDDRIYILSVGDETNGYLRDVLVFESSGYYSEVESWSVPAREGVCSLAVINDKVYVPDGKQLCVYSLTGTLITKIKHSSFSSPECLSPSPSESIIISDCEAEKVHKLNCKEEKITWTCSDVKEPKGVCCSNTGDVWVWSDDTNSLNLLSSDSGWFTTIFNIQLTKII